MEDHVNEELESQNRREEELVKEEEVGNSTLQQPPLRNPGDTIEDHVNEEVGAHTMIFTFLYV